MPLKNKYCDWYVSKGVNIFIYALFAKFTIKKLQQQISICSDKYVWGIYIHLPGSLFLGHFNVLECQTRK